MSKAHMRKEVISNISDAEHLAKFQRLLSQKHNAKMEPVTQDYMILRTKIYVAPKTPITLSVFTTDKLFFQVSPKIPVETFNSTVESILSLARQSVEILTKKATPTTLRAEQLLNYVESLNLDNEVERMITVFLCDIVIDLLLIEKLRSFRITDRKLLEGYIPTKLKALRKKITIPRDADIERLHIMRNGIAHGADIVSKSEAEWGRNLVRDVYKNL